MPYMSLLRRVVGQTTTANSSAGLPFASDWLRPALRLLILALVGVPTMLRAHTPAPGHGELMDKSFGFYMPHVHYYSDENYGYVESDGIPDAKLMPNLMVGITSWQQQIPLVAAFFGDVTNPDADSGSLGFGKPNVWRIPLIPVPAAASVSLNGNFLRGAVALAANGVPIFNPRNNRGEFSYAIGELDEYGGHCGQADDYHYHIAPTHLNAQLGNSIPIAWALDGYPIYGYLEPDGTAQLPLDSDGGHEHGSWGYHYHARGSVATGPTSPYLMDAMHGQVVNYGRQIDPQPEVQMLRPAGDPLTGAAITSFSQTAPDQFKLGYTLAGKAYEWSWTVDRVAHTVTLVRGTPTGTTTNTYTNAFRFNYYPMSAFSLTALPDTGQLFDATSVFGEDSDYILNPPAFLDPGDGTVTDTVTGLMWQKVDSGESTWENAMSGATKLNLAGYTDWRLPTAQEALSILNHNLNPALDSAFFVNNPASTPGYFWSSDTYYGDSSKVWVSNTGGGLGPHPKASTLSAGGTARVHARYVRGKAPSIAHNYSNNNDGTVTDLDTGLMWMQAPSSALNWTAALNYAEGLEWAGYSDWRLPNVKELQSLVDITRAKAMNATTSPCINTFLFPQVTATAYWSSTSVKAQTPSEAWVVEFGVNGSSSPPRNQQGIVSYAPYSSTYPVLVVRTTSIVKSQMTVTESSASLMDGSSLVNFGNVAIGSSSTKTFTLQNNGTSDLNLTRVNLDGASATSFSILDQSGTVIPSGKTITLVVQFNATTAGSKSAALHITYSDSLVGDTFDCGLLGTGVHPAPTVTALSRSPNRPGPANAVAITAKIGVATGLDVSQVQLSYNDGTLSTGPVFTETMGSSAATPWTGSGTDHPWTVNTTGPGNTFTQSTSAQHGSGNPCGLVFDKGTTTATDSMITTTDPIGAIGTSGSVEFYIATTDLISGCGWNFQTSSDGGSTWTTRLSELTGNNHSFQLYHYDLSETERVNTLKLRFQFVGYDAKAPTRPPKIYLDDIQVVTTAGNPPVTVDMLDDGLHGDSVARDGIYGAQIPAMPAGTTVAYSVTATDSGGGVTSSLPNQYTVGAISENAVLSGKVVYYANASEPMKGVSLTQSGGSNRSTVTGEDGSYSMEYAPGTEFTITPSQTADQPVATGVTTVDITLLRRHLLGITPLSAAFQLLAADVNASAAVDAQDIALLRRLILGSLPQFTEGSWRFVPSDVGITDPSNPWMAPKNRSYGSSVVGSLNGQDFLAIKLGDLNGSWTVPITGGAGSTAGTTTNVLTSKGSLSLNGVLPNSESEVVVSVKSEGFSSLTSIQFTVSWDPTALEMISKGDYGLPGLDSAHFGTEGISEGHLSFSWDPPQGFAVDLTPSTELFRLHLRPKRTDIALSQIRFQDVPTLLEVTENLEPISPSTSALCVRVENGAARIVTLPFVGISRMLDDGSVELDVWGRLGNRLRLERSSDLKVWSEVQSITVSASDPIRILVSGTANPQGIFLRVIETGP